MLSIILPVYNEEKAVEETIKEIKEVMHTTKQDYEIIAVNDGSTDSTSDILKTVKDITLITNPYNLGYGASIKKGIKACKGDWILITDSDGTYPIKDIPRLLEHKKDYDMVVGARKGKDVNIPLLRRPAKMIISMLANFTSARKIPDLNSGFRIFKKSVALEFFNLFPSGFSFTSTITLAALSNDYSVKYVTIEYYKRKGKSSISPVKDFIGFITLILRMVVYFKPIKLFTLLALILALAGVGILVYSKLYLDRLLDITFIITILSALQIFLIGLIADLIVRKREVK